RLGRSTRKISEPGSKRRSRFATSTHARRLATNISDRFFQHRLSVTTGFGPARRSATSWRNAETRTSQAAFTWASIIRAASTHAEKVEAKRGLWRRSTETGRESLDSNIRTSPALSRVSRKPTIMRRQEKTPKPSFAGGSGTELGTEACEYARVSLAW